MKTLTDTALQKMATKYKNSLDHVSYKLDGVAKTKDFTLTETYGSTVRAYIFFTDNIFGKITDIKVIDNDGDVVEEDKKIYDKVVGKGLYISFKHEFAEVDYSEVNE